MHVECPTLDICPWKCYFIWLCYFTKASRTREGSLDLCIWQVGASNITRNETLGNFHNSWNQERH